MTEYNNYVWNEVTERIESMSESVSAYDTRCRKLPRSLRDWEAVYRSIGTYFEFFRNFAAIART